MQPTGSFSLNRADLDTWLRKNRGYSLAAFDSTFLRYWPYPEDWLYALTLLESGFRPTAGHSVAIGLFGLQPRYYKYASRSARLSAHASSLREVVSKLKGKQFGSFIELYTNHFMPALYKALTLSPQSRFVLAPLTDGRAGALGFQYCALHTAKGSISSVVPLVDTFAYLDTIKRVLTELGIGFSVDPFVREFSVATLSGRVQMPPGQVLEFYKAPAALARERVYLEYQQTASQLEGAATLGALGPFASTKATQAFLPAAAGSQLDALETLFTNDGILPLDEDRGFVGSEESLRGANFGRLLWPTISSDFFKLQLYKAVVDFSTADAPRAVSESWDRSMQACREALRSSDILLSLAPVTNALFLEQAGPDYASSMITSALKFWDANNILSGSQIETARLVLMNREVSPPAELVRADLYPAVLGASLSQISNESLFLKLLMHGIYTEKGSAGLANDLLQGTLWHGRLMFPFSLAFCPTKDQWYHDFRLMFFQDAQSKAQNSQLLELADGLRAFGASISTQGQTELAAQMAQKLFNACLSAQQRTAPRNLVQAFPAGAFKATQLAIAGAYNLSF